MVQVDAVFTLLLNIKNKYTYLNFIYVLTCYHMSVAKPITSLIQVESCGESERPTLAWCAPPAAETALRRPNFSCWTLTWTKRRKRRTEEEVTSSNAVKAQIFFFFLKDLGVGYFISFFLKKSNRNSSHFDFFDQSPDWIRLFSSVKLIDVNVTARLWLAGRGGWMNPVWIIQTVWLINPQGQKTWM